MDFQELFPRMKFNNPLKQLEVVAAEAEELRLAFEAGDSNCVLEEGIDVVYSVLQLFYIAGYKPQDISQAIEGVKLKNKQRGYYK